MRRSIQTTRQLVSRTVVFSMNFYFKYLSFFDFHIVEKLLQNAAKIIFEEIVFCEHPRFVNPN